VERDRQRHEQGKPLADPEAEVVEKGTREVKEPGLTAKTGKVIHRGLQDAGGYGCWERQRCQHQAAAGQCGRQDTNAFPCEA
jgi:hypothetical protein